MAQKNMISLFAASAILMFLALVFAIVGDLLILVLLLIPAVLILFYTYIQSLYVSMHKNLKSSVSVIHQKQSIRGMMYGYLMRYNFFTQMDRGIQKTTLSGAIASGTLANPKATSKNIVVLFVICIAFASVLSVVGLILSEILFLASWVLPVLVHFSPHILNSLKSSEMASIYDAELGYFLAYLQVCITSNVGIYDAMCNLIGKDILESVEQDGVILQKWIQKDGYAESVAINHLANNHSNDNFQSFLFSYYEISQSNPHGLENFVSKTADAEFEKISTGEQKTIGKLSSVFVYGVMAMILVPVMMLTMLFLNSDESTVQLITYAVFSIPVGFTLYVFYTNNRHSDVTLHPVKISLAGLGAGLIWYVISSDALASVALSVSAVALYNGFYVRRQIFAWRSKTDGFPIFVRDLIERCKVDSNFVVSVNRLLESKNLVKKYGSFSEIIHSVKTRMYEITDVSKDLFYDGSLESKRLKLMMFVLQTVFDGGHGSSISSLERIYGFSLKLNLLKNTADDSLRMSSILLYAATPAFFVAMLGLSTVLGSFTSNMPNLTDLPPAARGLDIFVSPDYSELLTGLKPAILLMSLCAGVVISRVAYSSLMASMPIGICTVTAFVILTGWDVFFGIISSLLVF